MGVIIIDSEGRRVTDLTILDLVLMTLASWRVTRLFVYDEVTKWLREQFYNPRKSRTGIILEKPESGPRLTLANLFGCPWCFGVWASAGVVFIYLVFEWAYYPVLLLAVAAVATFMQLLSNLIGHKAEQLKRENEIGM